MLVAPWPNRRVTTFTSSGWETKSATLLSYFLPALLEHFVDLFRRQVLVKIVIHLCRWSPTASSDALHLFQRKQTIRRRSFVTHPQLLSAMLQNLFAAPNQAADVGANLHVELAARLGRQHRVVTDHVAHFQFGQIQPPGKFRNYFVG